MDATVIDRQAGEDDGFHPGAERRKGNILLLYWQSLRAGRPYPAVADVDPAAIANLWRFCFVASCAPVGLRFSYLGHAVRRGYGMNEGTTTAGAPPKVLEMLENPCQEVIQTGSPLLTDGVASNGWGDELRFRACICPMSDDGIEMSHLFGLVDYLELRREVVRGVQIETDIG
jgi:hypothetical protein